MMEDLGLNIIWMGITIIMQVAVAVQPLLTMVAVMLGSAVKAELVAAVEVHLHLMLPEAEEVMAADLLGILVVLVHLGLPAMLLWGVLEVQIPVVAGAVLADGLVMVMVMEALVALG